MTSFFRFVNKRAIYRLGIISLAHVPVHTFNPGNKIIKSNYLQVVNVLTSIFTDNNQHISKINNMRSAIKTCKHNIIVTDAPSI